MLEPNTRCLQHSNCCSFSIILEKKFKPNFKRKRYFNYSLLNFASRFDSNIFVALFALLCT